MHVPVAILHQAMAIYLQIAYPGGVPAPLEERLAEVRALGGGEVPLEKLEQNVADAATSFALRLGQPGYPHMKLVLDPVPGNAMSCRGRDFLLRVDAHDRHLHAPASSPDAAWLTGIRQRNKELVDQIESAWAAAGLPTFKEYLKLELQAPRNAKSDAPEAPNAPAGKS